METSEIFDHVYNGLNVCVCPKFTCGNSNPSMTAFGGGAFGK